MGSAANYAETKIGKAIFQNTTWTAGATLYVALGTAASDSAFTEVANSGGYARTAVTMSAANWPEDGTILGKFSNNISITSATATASWGTISQVALFDSATYGAGNMIVWNATDTAQAVGNGQAANFAIGAIVFTVD